MRLRGVCDPRGLTEAAVNQWVGHARANNTRRGRLARVCTLLRWCVRQGEAAPELVETLQSRENPLRAASPAVCRKVQGKYPAPWLTHAEAYVTLLGVCNEADVGLRDALIFRFGLAGMRVSEILRLGGREPRARDTPAFGHKPERVSPVIQSCT